MPELQTYSYILCLQDVDQICFSHQSQIIPWFLLKKQEIWQSLLKMLTNDARVEAVISRLKRKSLSGGVIFG